MTKGQITQEKFHIPRRKWNISFTQKPNPRLYWLMGSTFDFFLFYWINIQPQLLMTKGQMAQEKIHVPKRKWNPSFTQKLNPIHYWLMGSTFEMLSFIGSIYYPSC